MCNYPEIHDAVEIQCSAHLIARAKCAHLHEKQERLIIVEINQQSDELAVSAHGVRGRER